MSAAFYAFLQKEHSFESFDFLLEVKKLETMKEEKQIISKASEIIDTFVKVQSQKELNLSGELRDKTLKNYEKQKDVSDRWILDITPSKVFFESFQLVAGVLRHDPFKRFVRTDECEKVMIQYKNDSTVISPALTNIYSYSNDYFTHPHIDDKDFDYFKTLLEDNYNWKLIGSKVEEQVNAFTSETNYLPEVRISNTVVNAVKFETILPCTFDQALLSYFSNEMLMKSDPNCRRIRNIDYFDYEELKKMYKEQNKEDQITKYKRDLNVCGLDFGLPFPLNPRYANRADSCHYDPETKTFIRVGKNFYKDGEFGKSVKVEMAQKRGSEKTSVMKAYTFFLFSGTIFQKLDEKRILYKDLILMDLGGWASSQMMISQIVKERKDKFKGSILKMVSQYVPESMKFADCSEKLNKEVNGKPVDGFGKLIGNINFGENY
eukprot:gene11535-4788_t